jgi:hypothetical protein
MHRGEIKVLLEKVGDRTFVVATSQPEPRVGSLTMFFSGALGAQHAPIHLRNLALVLFPWVRLSELPC